MKLLFSLLLSVTFLSADNINEKTIRGYILEGERYEKGDSVKMDYVKAFNFYTKVCNLESVEGCYHLGRLNDIGYGGIKQNKLKAFELYTKSCNSNYADACYLLAGMYRSGEKVVQWDIFKAFKLYEKSCRLGSASACAALGGMYQEGNAVRQDNSKALKFFGKACDMESYSGCRRYTKLKDKKCYKKKNHASINSHLFFFT